MTPEIYTIIAMGIGLAGLILNGQRSLAELRRELGEVQNQLGTLRDQTSKDNSTLRGDLKQDNATLRDDMTQEMSAIRERMAHLEGLLEGLREAIVGRAA